jgi:hypothetical protein
VSGPAKAFREVVSAVIVDLHQAGEKYQYEIKGWLSAIVDKELSAVLVVAEDRSGHDRRQKQRTEISVGRWQIALEFSGYSRRANFWNRHSH